MAYRTIHLTLYRGAHPMQESSADLVLLWNLGGPVQANLSGQSIQMKKDDLLAVEPYTPWGLQAKDAFLAVFSLDAARMRSCFAGKNYHIQCNSARVVSDNYPPLRRILGQVLQAIAENSAYLEAELGRLYYELVLLLVQHFAVEMPGEVRTRAEQFVQYVEDHFQEELSLRQISEAFHMTPQYFSRQFKSQTGQTFYRSLTAVRLRHAKQDLAETDLPLLRVAMDNGFANLESFYRFFQEDVGQSPQEWRATCQKEADNPAQLKGLMEWVGDLARPASLEEDCPAVRTVDVSHRERYHSFWREVLHLGDAALLDDTLIAAQLHTLQSDLRFRFIRIQVDWKGFRLGEEYSFYREERRWDDLLDQGFNLWFYVEFRQLTEPERMYAYLDRMLSHFANRYSIQNVQKWRVELVYNTIFTPEKAQAYWACRQRLQAILNKYGCTEPLLCAGLALGAPKAVESFCAELARRGEIQAAQTFEAEPYVYYETGQGPVLSRATDSSYLKNQILTLQQNQTRFREMVQDIYITNWNDNMLTTSGMNDSCYKGANLLKTMIDCFGRVRSVAHNIPLDAVYPDKVKRNILFGGNGLLSQHGIPKPSYYAYSFLCRVGEYYLDHDEHSILFAGKEGNYQILCHNCKRLNYKYYLDEQKSGLGDLEQYFEETEPLTLRYRLTGVRDGRYILKQRMISPEVGSVQDLLRAMGASEGIYVHSHELEYLRQVSVPQLRLQEVRSIGGELNIQLTVPANAILYLHIIYQY